MHPRTAPENATKRRQSIRTIKPSSRQQPHFHKPQLIIAQATLPKPKTSGPKPDRKPPSPSPSRLPHNRFHQPHHRLSSLQSPNTTKSRSTTPDFPTTPQTHPQLNRSAYSLHNTFPLSQHPPLPPLTRTTTTEKKFHRALRKRFRTLKTPRIVRDTEPNRERNTPIGSLRQRESVQESTCKRTPRE
jgi:hypothetical protein